MKTVLLMLMSVSSVAMAKSAGDCWVEFGQRRIDNLTRQIYLEHTIPVIQKEYREDSMSVPKFGNGREVHLIKMQGAQDDIKNGRIELADLKMKAKELRENFEKCQAE